MNKILNFYQLIVFTNFKKKILFFNFFIVSKYFCRDVWFYNGYSTYFFNIFDSDKGIGVEYLDYLIFNIINNSYDLNHLFNNCFFDKFFFIAKLILLTFSSYKIFSFSQTLGEKIANQTFFYELNKNYIRYIQRHLKRLEELYLDTLQLSSSLSGLIMMLIDNFFHLLLGLFLTINLKLFYPVLIIFLVALVYIRFSKTLFFRIFIFLKIFGLTFPLAMSFVIV